MIRVGFEINKFKQNWLKFDHRLCELVSVHNWYKKKFQLYENNDLSTTMKNMCLESVLQLIQK